MNIILARHAETPWNEQARYIGRTDLSLSALGRKNALLLADFLAPQALDMVFSSDMRRAKETAVCVADAKGLKVLVEPLLNEIDFGCWEGLKYDEILMRDAELLEKWVENPFSVRVPESEPLEDFAKRVWAGWRAVIERALKRPAGNVLVVTHAGCIKIILGRLLGRERERWWQIYQDKGALNHIEIGDEATRVVEINDTSYRKTGGS